MESSVVESDGMVMVPVEIDAMSKKSICVTSWTYVESEKYVLST